MRESIIIRHFQKLLMGNILTQIISLISYILIVRIYTREELGQLGNFIALTSFFSLFHSAQIHLTFFSNDQIANSRRLCDSFLTSIILTPIIFLGVWALYLKSDFGLGKFIFLIPINSLLFTLFDISKAYFNREEKFNSTVVLNISDRLTAQALKIGGLITARWILLVSEPIGHLVALALLKNEFKFANLRSLREIYNTYKSYAFYYIPINLINFFTTEGPVLIASYLNSADEATTFFLLNRLVFSPLTLIGNSFSSSIMKKLSGRTKGERIRFLIKIYTVFGGVGIVSGIFVWLTAPWFATFILGLKYLDVAVTLQTLSFVIPLRILKGVVQNAGLNSGRFKLIYLNKIFLGISLLGFVLISHDWPIQDVFIGYYIIEVCFELIHLIIGISQKI